MRWKAKDPQFGAKKPLYKVQDKVAGLLPCLLHNLLNTDTEVSVGKF